MAKKPEERGNTKTQALFFYKAVFCNKIVLELVSARIPKPLTFVEDARLSGVSRMRLLTYNTALSIESDSFVNVRCMETATISYNENVPPY